MPRMGTGRCALLLSGTLLLSGLLAGPLTTSAYGATGAGVTGYLVSQPAISIAPSVITKAAASVAQTTATLNATVNPNGGEVSKCEFEYGETISYGKTAPCVPSPGAGEAAVAVSAPISGLTANTTYHFRISATNATGTSKGADETLKTLPNAPTVITKAATSVTQTTATLTATVNPNGGEVSKCEFEYGETNSYGKTVSCTTLPGSGTSPVEVSAPITGLTANSTYHFRISATNAGGTSKGADETFKTLPNAPTVITKAATSVTQTTAALNATVNPTGGEATKCEFEYGETISYGKTASCASLPGSGTSAVEVSAAISALSANTTYHFRISATNAGGTSKGVDETFKTLPNAPTVISGPASSTAKAPAILAVLFFHEQNPAAGSLKLMSTSLTASASGAVSVSVSCPAGQGYCRGTMVLRTLKAVAVSGQRGKPAILTLARSSFDLVGGRKGILRLRLSASARTLLAKAHVLRASATVVTQAPAGTAQSQTIVNLRRR